MAVTFDAVGPSSSGVTNTAISPITWSHTNGASADWLLAAVALDGGSSITPAHNAISAMTYNAVSMGTALLNWQTGGAAQTSGYLALYGLANPATGGADTASATYTNTGMDGTEAGSISFVTGGGSLGTPAHADSNGSSVASGSITVATTSANSLVAAFVTNGSGGLTFTSGTSRMACLNTGTAAGGAWSVYMATIPGTGGNVTVNWTQTSDFYAAIAVEVLPPGGPTSGPALPARFTGQRPVTVVTNAGWRGAQHSR